MTSNITESHRVGGLALYPGSFDPFTMGHLDIVERASRVFGSVVVTVANNSSKSALFTPEERKTQIDSCTEHLSNVTSVLFSGLIVDFAKEVGAIALVRGLRQVADFDYEFRLAFANRRLAPNLETMFFMTNEHHALISASIVRDILNHGGDISSFVPAAVLKAIQQKSPNS